MKQSLYKYYLTCFTTLALLSQGCFSVYADESIDALTITPAVQVEKKETIKQIQESINTLQKEKNHLEFKWDTYRIGNDTLGDLMRTDLDEAQREYLESIIIDYIDSQDEYDGKIERALESKSETEKIKLEFLSEKRAFYMGLIQFIQVDKLEQYKNYVDSDINYNEKSNQVATQIEQRNIEKEERIEEIQNHIDTNKNILRDRIKLKVTNRVREKLDRVTSEEKFKQLSDGGKAIVFQKLQTKVQEKINELETNPDSKSAEENLFLYQIIDDILQGYIDDWNNSESE